MGEVIYLFPWRPSAHDPLTSICLNYQPLGYERKSCIYEMSPELCGTCKEYMPDRGRCAKLPFRRECVCVSCGGFYLDRPGAGCSACGERLAAIAAPCDW